MSLDIHDFDSDNQADEFLSYDFLQENELQVMSTPRYPMDSKINSDLAHFDLTALPELSELPDISFPAISGTVDNSPLSNMAKSISCQKFSGYPHENGERFLNEFNSYATLINVHYDSARKIAALHLHLNGPALTWFNNLDTESKQSWDELMTLFKARFVKLDNPSMMMASEAFQTLTLLPGQPVEDYYCQVLEKGTLMGKPEFEIISKFLSGLPSELSFFVRAGAPKTLEEALSATKMGETCGYRKHNAGSPSLCAMTSPAQQSSQRNESEIQDLKNQVSKLTTMMETLIQGHQPQLPAHPQHSNPYPAPMMATMIPGQQHQLPAHSNSYPPMSTGQHRQNQRDKAHFTPECYACHGMGHLRRECNWIGEGESAPGCQCQLCFQYGHSVPFCRMYNGRSGHHSNNRHQGNQQHLRRTNPPPSSGNQ